MPNSILGHLNLTASNQPGAHSPTKVAGKVFNPIKTPKQKNQTTMRYLTPILIILLSMLGCSKPTETEYTYTTKPQINESPTTLLNESLKAFEELHEWILAGKPIGKHNAIFKFNKQTADSIWIYGDTLPGNIGVVITEKHSYPKGLLLITKNYKYGDYDRLEIVSIAEKFISWTQYHNKTPETKTITQISFANPPSKTIITHITKWTKGIQTRETFTFKEPIITIDNSKGIKTIRQADPSNEVIVTEIREISTNKIIQSKWTGPSSTYKGGFFTRTNNYDNGNLISWTKTTTLGKPDGSIIKYIDRYP